MSWLDKLSLLNGLYGKYKTVQKLDDYAKRVTKLKPGDIEEKQVRYFSNPVTAKAMKEARAVLDAAEQAEKAKLIYPRVGIDAAMAKYAHFYDKKGPDSKEYKKARNTLLQVFYKHSDGLVKMQAGLKEQAAQLEKSQKLAQSLAKYCELLEKNFALFVKVPNLGGTGSNSEFFALHRDMSVLKGIHNDIAKAFARLAKKNAAFQKEVTDSQKTANKMQRELKEEQNNDPAYIKAQTKALEAILKSML